MCTSLLVQVCDGYLYHFFSYLTHDIKEIVHYYYYYYYY